MIFPCVPYLRSRIGGSRGFVIKRWAPQVVADVGVNAGSGGEVPCTYSIKEVRNISISSYHFLTLGTAVQSNWKDSFLRHSMLKMFILYLRRGKSCKWVGELS